MLARVQRAVGGPWHQDLSLRGEDTGLLDAAPALKQTRQHWARRSSHSHPLRTTPDIGLTQRARTVMVPLSMPPDRIAAATYAAEVTDASVPMTAARSATPPQVGPAHRL